VDGTIDAVDRFTVPAGELERHEVALCLCEKLARLDDKLFEKLSILLGHLKSRIASQLSGSGAKLAHEL
jgi:hypothetical protein